MERVGSVLHHMTIGHFQSYGKWPWQHFNSLEKQLSEHPSFVVGEFLFIATAMLSLYHAWTTPDPNSKRRLKLVWITTLVGGTVNDYFFMLLPIVDNFWQAQAVFMLTPRMPLYIPCVYITFMYWPIVIAARVFCFTRKDILAEACFAGLLAGITYAPYDVNGARFLWWTWHDDDAGVKLRWFGVPAGSTLWTITFTASMSFLLRLGSNYGFRQLATLMLGCLSVLLMMVVINPFCIIGMAFGEDRVGKPGRFSLLAAICIMGAIVARCVVRASEHKLSLPQLIAPERLSVRCGLICYFLVHVLVMSIFSPERQISTGAHQLYSHGQCGSMDFDLMGLPRVQYICAQKYPDWYFSFECDETNQHLRDDGQWWLSGRWARFTPDKTAEVALWKVKDSNGVFTGETKQDSQSSWYTICGTRHESWHQWMLLQVVLAIIGVVAYVLALNYSTRYVIASDTTKEKKELLEPSNDKDSKSPKVINNGSKVSLQQTTAGKKPRSATPPPKPSILP